MPQLFRFAFLLICLVFPLSTTAQVVDIPDPSALPFAVREAFELSPFYQLWIDVEGLPVVASAKVNPYAMKEAAWLIRQMIGHRPDILQAMVHNKTRIAVMAHTEFITDIPEFSDLRPAFYWNRRARGLGATPERPVCFCGEENLLNYPGDFHWDFSCLIHEFAHTIHLTGLNTVDPGFHNRLRTTYDEALRKGLWRGTYAATNAREYWAEGTQYWFNGTVDPHKQGNTRADLKIYDPALATLLAEVYSDGPWRYTPAPTRTHLPHLRGFNPQDSPKFEWPPELTALYEQLSQPDSDGGGKWVNLIQYDPNLLPRLINESRIPGGLTEILFVNLSQTDVLLYWVAPDGTETFWERFAPDPRHIGLVFTYVRYVWLVKDPSGRNLAVFQAVEKTGRIVVLPPGVPKPTIPASVETTHELAVIMLGDIKRTALFQNFPNPFNPETWIPYQLASAADVKLTIYDTKGVTVRQFDLGHQTGGSYMNHTKAVYWDGRNHAGESVGSGVYFYQISAGDYSATRKMVMLK